MKAKLTPREQRRIDTDDHILQAAIHQFGSRGFTSASLTDIAAEAGISQGLVSQRFESKERLLEAAFKATPAVSFYLKSDSGKQDAAMPATQQLSTILLSIVRALKKEQQAQKRRFAFITMLYTARDVPESFTALSLDLFRKTELPALIKDAQTAGVLVKGDAYRLFGVFYRNCLAVIHDCTEAGLPFPADENFLTPLGLGSTAVENIPTQKEGVQAGSKTATADIGAFVEQVKPAFRAVEGYIGLIKKHAGEKGRVSDYAEKAELIATELVKNLEKLKQYI